MSVAIIVNIVNLDLQVAKAINCVVISQSAFDSQIKSKDLKALRDILLGDPSVKSSVQRLPFCTRGGAEVREAVNFNDYEFLVQGLSDRATTSLPEHNVYFRKAPIVSNNWKRLADVRNPESSVHRADMRAIGLSEYDHADWQALEPGVDFDYAVDMTEKQWDAVLRSTNLLSGNVVTFTDFKNPQKPTEILFSVPKLERAAYPAFRVKARALLEFEQTDLDIPVDKVRMPIFQVTDQAYVEVYETSTYMAQSMAGESFSKLDIEASVGGGGFGYSAEMSAGFSQEQRESWAKSHESSSATMNISYNFPRVTLYLDQYSLEVTQECKAELEDIQSQADYLRFHRRYGQLYPQRVTLGGRLYSSQRSDSFSSHEESKREELMKVSASMSFKAPFVQGSASTSRESGLSEEQSSDFSKSNGSITWHANGGDSLLCNNPPAWCPTVASHYYWRVQQQTDTLPILDLMEKIPEVMNLAMNAKKHAP